MKFDDNVLGKGIEAIFQKTAHLRDNKDKTLELPNGTISREADELIIRLNLDKRDDIRGAVKQLAEAADNGMLDQLVDLGKIKTLLAEHIEMAQMAVDDGDNSSAISELKDALLIVDNANIRFNLAFLYEQMKKTNKAIKQYLKILDMNPKHVKSLNNLGLIYYRRDDIVKAMDYYHKAVKTDPTLSEKAKGSELFAPRFGYMQILV